MKHTSNWGKYHAPNCECTYNFTCRACLDNAPKYFWTPNAPTFDERTDQHPSLNKKDSDTD